MQEGIESLNRGTPNPASPASVLARGQDLDFEALTRRLAGRLIYLVGNARGGSTFANSAVGIHPQILCVEWNDITFAEIWPHIDKFEETQLRKKLLRPKHFREAVAEANIGRAALGRLYTHVEHICRSRDLCSLFCLQALLFWVMQCERPLTDYNSWCVKANTWDGVDAIKQAMPLTRTIFVERDPRANALSFAKAYARQREQAFGDHDLVRGALDWLRNAVEFGSRLNCYDDALLLYFESAVADPVASLNRIYGELGLDPLEASVILAALAEIEYTSTKTYAERDSGPNPRGLHAAPLSRWREQLSQEQIDMVSALTQPGARYYNYQTAPSPRFWAVANALQRSDPARFVKSWLVYFYCRMRLALMPKPKQVALWNIARS